MNGELRVKEDLKISSRIEECTLTAVTSTTEYPVDIAPGFINKDVSVSNKESEDLCFSKVYDEQTSKLWNQYIPCTLSINKKSVDSTVVGYIEAVCKKLALLNLIPTSSVNNGFLPRNNAAVDLFTTIACFLYVHFMYLGHLDISSNRTLVLFGALVSLVSFLYLGGTYAKRKYKSLNRELGQLFLCWIAAFATVGLFAFLTKAAGDVSRVWITVSMVSTLVLLGTFRVLNRIGFYSSKEHFSRNIIACGFQTDTESLLENLFLSSKTRIEVSRVFEFTRGNQIGSFTKSRIKALAQPIVDHIENERQSGIPVEQVWIAVPSNQSDIVEELTRILSDSSVDVCVAPDTYTERLLKGDKTTVGNTDIINISEVSLPPASDQFKRVFDICAASVGLLLLSIPMAIIAGLIKLDSPGPAVFRQKRYGVDGKEFDVLKFRSMKLHNDSEVIQATKEDSRVTSIGRLLRKTSLDELPQLINVLQGTMSLVGPRPHAVAHNETWRTQINGYMLRHKVRPGITGLAQVNGWRGETDTAYKMRQRVKYDLKYIQEWSPWLDIKILFLTVLKGLSGENAY